MDLVYISGDNVALLDHSYKADPVSALSRPLLDQHSYIINTNGTTHYCQIITEIDDLYQIKVLTDTIGNFLPEAKILLVPKEQIVSKRPYKLFTPHFYFYNDEPIITGYANKSLMTTSTNGFGTGIYGYYYYQPLNTDTINLIELQNPFYLQDEEHGINLTQTAQLTHHFLDTKILLNNNNINEILFFDELTGLYNLWNMVLSRVNNKLSQEELYDILGYYLLYYNNEIEYKLMPTNFIFSYLGYDGIIAEDIYNNKWDRGCVAYTNKNYRKEITTASYFI